MIGFQGGLHGSKPLLEIGYLERLAEAHAPSTNDASGGVSSPGGRDLLAPGAST